ncbi:nitrilase-related carbon-nitrogen hydrolase [Salipaludibacillus daqingensis]|uniref:nitrilase-related carbon-nitrogen hydrolase n=1 Tax=Salipaludibacillus daqingensis TaxID=3041001 RepID=UPI002475A9BF|nr:nitrilase-related carbon-nitrogen hydrolase [Salipaludibacillus daqingensis]
MLKIAGVQMFSDDLQVSKNKQKAIELVKEAANNGAKMICLPELWVTGYNLKKEDLSNLAETHDGETVNTFKKLAKQLGVVLVIPFLESENMIDTKKQSYYISAAIIDCDGSIVGVYRKSMLWGTEKNIFTAGEKVYEVYHTSLGSIGVLICYDIEFPEPARALALKGAQLIFVPSVWSFEAEPRWDIQLPARALDNSLYIFGINTYGNNSCGKSKLLDPNGSLLTCAPKYKEEIIYGNIDFQKILETRKRIPYIADLPSRFISKDLMENPIHSKN